MKNREFILSCNKTILILYEDELLRRLPIDLLATAIQRGKGYRRSLAVAKREKPNMTPWTDERGDLD